MMQHGSALLTFKPRSIQPVASAPHRLRHGYWPWSLRMALTVVWCLPSYFGGSICVCFVGSWPFQVTDGPKCEWFGPLKPSILRIFLNDSYPWLSISTIFGDDNYCYPLGNHHQLLSAIVTNVQLAQARIRDSWWWLCPANLFEPTLTHQEGDRRSSSCIKGHRNRMNSWIHGRLIIIPR